MTLRVLGACESDFNIALSKLRGGDTRVAQIPTVCGSLREALYELEADHDFLLAGGVFSKSQLEGYMALKWEEVYAFEHTPHPVEYKMYYSC